MSSLKSEVAMECPLLRNLTQGKLVVIEKSCEQLTAFFYFQEFMVSYQD